MIIRTKFKYYFLGIKDSNNSRVAGHFKLVILNDYNRNYIKNDDGIINVWFCEKIKTAPPHVIISIKYQSLKENEKQKDFEIILSNTPGNIIIGDASCA